jgi:nucleoside 2-deoxyribosyltransferase
MYLLVCPCIQDPGLRAQGITHDRDLHAFEQALIRCDRFGIAVRCLPCPETLYLGKNREPATFNERLDTPAFHDLLSQLEGMVREMITNSGPPLAIMGVDSSPVCGVNQFWKSPAGRIPGRGAFLEKLSDIPAYDVYAVAAFRIYLAGPLFSEAERLYNLKIARLLRSYSYEVYLPQETGDTDASRGSEAHKDIFIVNHQALDAADLVVAVIDGADADSGTAWEIGYAFARGIPVYAIRTDFRMVGSDERVNLMLEQSSILVTSQDALIAALPSPLPVDFSSSGDEEKECRN